MNDRPSRKWMSALLTLLIVPLCCSCQPAPSPGADAAPPVGDADDDTGIADADPELDADPEGQPEGGPDADNPCLPDPDADLDADPDVEVPADAEPDGPVEADLDGDGDSDADLDRDERIDAEADDEPDGDLESEGGLDADLTPCPEEMSALGASCIDRYEASRSDATSTDQGLATDRALSRPGVLPWSVNPMTLEALSSFEAACVASGKRLCSLEEWVSACAGPGGSTYVFGHTFDPEVCNCVDTFCDDFCLDSGIPEESCETGGNCGYTYSCYRVMPTGSFPGCTNGLGTFDVNGNVWEVVPSLTDPRGYEVRGGAFNCASAASRLQCTFNAGWITLHAGFRCCRDR